MATRRPIFKMALVGFSLASGSAAMAFQWRHAVATPQGVMTVPGVGNIDGLAGGFPTRGWTAPAIEAGFSRPGSQLADVDGDGLPEAYLSVADTIARYAPDGTLLARSQYLGGGHIVGFYDLDGDGVAHELVVAAGANGGRVWVLDALSLASLWHAGDVNNNVGVARGRIAVHELDGVPGDEIVWRTTPGGWLTVTSFGAGIDQPVSVTPGTQSTRTASWPGSMPVFGQFLAGGGTQVVTNQFKDALMLEVVPDTDPDASCVGALCVAETEYWPGIHRSWLLGAQGALQLDDDPEDELLTAGYSLGHPAEIIAYDPGDGALTGLSDDLVKWSYSYGSGLRRVFFEPDATGVSSLGEPVVGVGVEYDGVDEVDHAGAPADDCLDYPAGTGGILFDGATGIPLATLPGTQPVGAVDADGDGVTEFLFTDVEDGTGTLLFQTTAYELVCSGVNNSADFTDCSQTGCTLIPQYSLPARPMGI